MLILGGKDYYDIASSFGVDKTIVLNRTTELFEPSGVTDKFSFTSAVTSYYYTDKQIIGGVVIFCGKSYPFVRISSPFTPEKNCAKGLHAKTTKTFYSPEDFRAGVEWAYDECNKYKWNRKTYDRIVSTWFKENTITENLSTEFLIETSSAFSIVFTHKNEKKKYSYWKNPACLIDFDFMKVKDAYAAYMDIMNWQSGVLTDTKETVALSDKSKIIKAGFDTVTSFRKQKEVSK